MCKKPLRILSIDDSLGRQLAAAKFLTLTGGHIVEVAENGREGLKKADQLRPDAILLNTSMPDMSGSEVMDSLCENSETRDIPVIIIARADMNKAEYNSLRQKRNFLLLEQKPIDFTRILRTIEGKLTTPADTWHKNEFQETSSNGIRE